MSKKMPPLAWFFLEDLSDEEQFRIDVEKHGGRVEGVGQSPAGVVQGFAEFRDAKHLASFQKKHPAYPLDDYAV